MDSVTTSRNGTLLARTFTAPSPFIDAVFLPEDTVLIRPIESWVEKGTDKKPADKKRSRVVYKKVRHIQAYRLAGEPVIWGSLLKVGEEERANLFFGVCPRFGGRKQFDLAWQIRVVRVLWADIDYCTVEEALQRCEAAGLPRPSVLVRSGNGVHLYWLLIKPYLIDDAGDPPPVLKEFIDQSKDKKKKALRYFIDPQTKAKVYEYLDEGRSGQKNPDWPTLSPKGRHVQDVLAGIAARIDGDHTTDLSRVLRLPGTLNRKDQRNGKQPVPCELVECDPERRYPFADFERFAAAAPDRVRVEAAAKIRLPTGKKLTPHRRNKLNDFINACAVADTGGRSEPDFALCAWCIEHGFGADDVWSHVQDVGKFGERGRDYFDLSWSKAEAKVRLKLHDRACRRAGVKPVRRHEQPTARPGENQGGTPLPTLEAHAENVDRPLIFTNYYQSGSGEEGDPVIKCGYSAQYLAGRVLTLTDGYPRRVGQRLFAATPEPAPLWLEEPHGLLAWVAGHLPGGRDNALEWAGGPNMLTAPQFHAYLAQTVESYDAVEPYPHHPPMPRHFYMHPPIRGGDGRAFEELLARFKPASLVDADLIRAFFLSLLWGGRPGQRPAWLFTSDDEDDGTGRGVGKSKVAMLGSRLVGGFVRVSPDEDMEKLMPRLLSPAAMVLRVALLDNVKSLRFSWAELECCITSDVLSGKQLYYGEGRRPNTLTWCITLNGANLSTDLAQRCVIVKVARPDYSANWEEDTAALIEAKRWEIIGDILAALQAPAEPLRRYSRWGAWEAGVLARVPDPSECQKVIEERQSDVDDDQTEASLVRDYFAKELRERGHDPDTEVVWIPAAEAAVFVNTATGERRATGRASVYLGTLKIRTIRRSDRQGARGWVWAGVKTTPGQTAGPLNPRPEFNHVPEWAGVG